MFLIYQGDMLLFGNLGLCEWHHFQPTGKIVSMQWQCLSSLSPEKNKSQPSAGKVMLTVFFRYQCTTDAGVQAPKHVHQCTVLVWTLWDLCTLYSTSIRQTVNWKNTPAYQLATHLSTLIKQYTELLNSYNINNTTHLISTLQNTSIDQNTRICLFDITNMYTNIPTNIITKIIHETLENKKRQ